VEDNHMMWWVEGVKEIVNTSLSMQEGSTLADLFSQPADYIAVVYVWVFIALYSGSFPLSGVYVCRGYKPGCDKQNHFKGKVQRKFSNTNGSSVQLSSAQFSVGDGIGPQEFELPVIV